MGAEETSVQWWERGVKVKGDISWVSFEARIRVFQAKEEAGLAHDGPAINISMSAK